MPTAADNLRAIKTFPDLVRYLEDELDWPLQEYGFDELTFEYSPAELGLRDEDAAKIKTIHQLRPVVHGQPFGIFFIEFESRRMPVVVLRRILSHLVLKKRATANRADITAWNLDDLLFISAFGDAASDQREIAFAHFRQEAGDLPTLRVLGWDGADTGLKLDYVADVLHARLCWPDDPADADAWRDQWSAAFRHLLGHVIRTADALAERLAELARGIRAAAITLMRHESERGPLRQLHKAFQTALIHDLTEDQFADTYAQTVTYGLLTAAIQRTDPQGGRHDTTLYPNMLAEVVPITNPFLREMLQTFLHIGGQRGGINFDELGVQDVVDLLRGDETDLPAILRDFGNRTRGEDPVIHFYEHFLAAYDKKLKVQRGIFYTPQPVVSYIVRSVHELLQTEFGLADGLASTVTWGEMRRTFARQTFEVSETSKVFAIPEGTDPAAPFVTILDPATGTATFLVEVIDVIHKHLRARWQRGELRDGALIRSSADSPSADSPSADSPMRTFEDFWNAYVPQHLLPRLHGYELMMAPYAIAHMKIGLKLHETGYRFGSIERVRVYLTNALEPPDDARGQLAFAGWTPALAHEAQAVKAIKRWQRFTVVIGNPPYSNFGQMNRIPFVLNLLEDYKHDLDEKKINLDDDFIKFVRFSQALLDKTGAGVLGFITNNVYLDGMTHRRMRQSLMGTFSCTWILDLHGSAKKLETSRDSGKEENVFDIQQGVAVGVFLKFPAAVPPVTAHADLWGTREAKYRALDSGRVSTTAWCQLKPAAPHFFFVPKDFSGGSEYEVTPSLAEVFVVFQNGLKTDRDELFFDFNRGELERRIRTFYSQNYDAEFVGRYGIHPSSSYDIESRRDQTRFSIDAIYPCLYRPFDSRWLYYDPNLTSRPATKVMRHQLAGGNIALICLRQTRRSEEGTFLVSRNLINKDAVSLFDIGTVFPLWLYDERVGFDLDGMESGVTHSVNRRSNFSVSFLKTLASTLQLLETGAYDFPKCLTPEDIFHYIYAIFHAPTYRARYAEFLKIDFPRVPLTGSRDLFRALAALGGDLVALHLLEDDYPGASWNVGDHGGDHAGSPLRRPITTYAGPAAPTVEKVTYADGAVWVDKAQTAGFRGVPEAVWAFHIGGYQVCEKWLKDRKGRTLSAADIEHYQRVVVALNETIRIMGEIDAAIEDHGGWPIR
jgi:hypothetical protein